MSLCDSLMPDQKTLGFNTHNIYDQEIVGKIIAFSPHFTENLKMDCVPGLLNAKALGDRDSYFMSWVLCIPCLLIPIG